MRKRLLFGLPTWGRLALLAAALALPAGPARAWGFFGHRLLNRLAVYTLPPEMLPFFKANIDYLTNNATRPDSRRTVVPTEAPRHFMDVDVYGDSALTRHGLPRAYADAVALAGGEDSLLRHGIVPWQVARMKGQLTAAFQAGDTDRILYLAADLGHYVADACVPLHQLAHAGNAQAAFINPQMVSETGTPWGFEEGCLSIPGVRELVQRCPDIVLRYEDENRQVHEEGFSGMAARIIQHEYDHLEGILFTDKLSAFKKQLLKGRLARISKGDVKHDYRMKFTGVGKR